MSYSYSNICFLFSGKITLLTLPKVIIFLKNAKRWTKRFLTNNVMQWCFSILRALSLQQTTICWHMPFISRLRLQYMKTGNRIKICSRFYKMIDQNFETKAKSRLLYFSYGFIILISAQTFSWHFHKKEVFFFDWKMIDESRKHFVHFLVYIRQL